MDTQTISVFKTFDSLVAGKLRGGVARLRILTSFAVLFERRLESYTCSQIEQLIQCIKTTLNKFDEFAYSSDVPIPQLDCKDEDVFICLVRHGLAKDILRECFLHVILFVEYRWLLVRMQPRGADHNVCDVSKTTAIVHDFYLRNLGDHILDVLNTPTTETISEAQVFYTHLIQTMLAFMVNSAAGPRGDTHSSIKMTNDDLVQQQTIEDYVYVMIEKLMVWEKENGFPPLKEEPGEQTDVPEDFHLVMKMHEDQEFQRSLNGPGLQLFVDVPEERGLQPSWSEYDLFQEIFDL